MRPPMRRPPVLLARSVGPCGACPCSTPTTEGRVKCYQKWAVGYHTSHMSGIGGFVFLLGGVSFAAAILANSFLWRRFTSRYVRATPERMPFLPVDFGGRWRRALATPHPDLAVDRVRRQLRLSQLLLLLSFAVAVLGVALLIAFPA